MKELRVSCQPERVSRAEAKRSLEVWASRCPQCFQFLRHWEFVLERPPKMWPCKSRFSNVLVALETWSASLAHVGESAFREESETLTKVSSQSDWMDLSSRLRSGKMRDGGPYKKRSWFEQCHWANVSSTQSLHLIEKAWTFQVWLQY